MTKLFVKQCAQCGSVFKTDNKRVKLCSNCKEENQKNRQLRQQKYQKELYKAPYKRKPKTKVDLSLIEATRLLEEYNHKHKTHYTYGQFVESLENEKIKE